MAHFAKVVNNIVTKVIVAEPDFFNTLLDSSPGQWLQTSYNTRGGIHYDPQTGAPSTDQSKALRKNYAGVGFKYDPILDAFYEPQPYPSWTLNQDTCMWESPVPYPNDGGIYDWDEDTQTWVVVEGG